MRRVVDITIILFIICTSACKQKQAPDALPQTGNYLDTAWIESEDTLRYRMLLPTDFRLSQQYPVVLFLHGMGERGTDNQTQLTHGSTLFSDSIDQYPAIVIFPQCPPTDYWANLDRSGFDSDSLRLFQYRLNENPHPSLKLVMGLLDNLIHQPYVDPSRIYLSGLSMGAMGSFDILWRMPNTFAVCMPICGSGPIEQAQVFQQTPFWIFHGGQDRTVATRHSIEMVDTLRVLNANVRFTLYPEANHNSWDSAFAEPEFLKWMFSHQLKKDQ